MTKEIDQFSEVFSKLWHIIEYLSEPLNAIAENTFGGTLVRLNFYWLDGVPPSANLITPTKSQGEYSQ